MLNSSEREKLVIDLYYNQGKNVREIAQAKMSFRDIGAILKKNEVSDGGNVICNGDNNNNKSSKEEATRL
jgi:hypothetical protein